MLNPSVARTVLSLFTTAEKAEEIEGDLIEQARVYGSLWFGMHVILISLALFRQTVLQQPLLVLLPGYAVYELVAKLHLWAIQPLRRYLQYDLDYSAALLLSATRLVWIIAGYSIGRILVQYLRRTGMAVVITAAALILLRVFLLNEVTSISAVMFLVVPVLLGGFHATSVNIQKGPPTEISSRAD